MASKASTQIAPRDHLHFLSPSAVHWNPRASSLSSNQGRVGPGPLICLVIVFATPVDHVYLPSTGKRSQATQHTRSWRSTPAFQVANGLGI